MTDGFDTIRLNKSTLYVNQNFRNNDFEQSLLAGEKNLKGRYQAVVIPSSRFANVFKFTVRFDDVDRGVYFKQYLCRSVWDFIKHLFRTSRARRAFKAAMVLEKNGFSTPVIIAMGGDSFGFFRTGNFLITLEVNGAESIRKFISESLAALSKEQLRDGRRLICQFGRTIGRMHAAGIFHGDLRLGNVLSKQDKVGWRFFFLDNERTHKFRRLPFRLRLKNLVQINMFRSEAIGNTDRMRFFIAYLEENPQLIAKRNKLAERIVSKTLARMNNTKSS